jgi:hypothetical protein
MSEKEESNANRDKIYFISNPVGNDSLFEAWKSAQKPISLEDAIKKSMHWSKCSGRYYTSLRDEDGGFFITSQFSQPTPLMLTFKEKLRRVYRRIFGVRGMEGDIDARLYYQSCRPNQSS